MQQQKPKKPWRLRTEVKKITKPAGYIYTVCHPDYGEAEIVAEDRIQASKEACHVWGASWVHEGKRCTVTVKGQQDDKS